MNRHPLALVAALFLAAPAFALPVTIHNFQNGYATVNTVLNGNASALHTGTLMGEFNGGASNSFLTYCNDLMQSFSWNVTYNDYQLVATGAAHGLTVIEAASLGRLYTTAGAIDTLDKSVAFQLAVWELTHDNTPGNLYGGNFSITSGASVASVNLAQSWLSAATSVATPNDFVVTRLYSPSAQDFLVVSPRTHVTNSSAPEPAGFALAAVALLALGITRRRSARL